MSKKNFFISDEKPIGKGAFGEVYIVYDANDKNEPKIKYAAKRIPNFEGIQELNKTSTKGMPLFNNFCNEIEINSQFTNENLVTFFGIEEIKGSNYMIFEYCNGLDLNKTIIEYQKKYCKKIPERYIQKILKDIMNGLSCLHRNLIVHHDIKLQNILVKYDNEEDKINLNLDKATYKITDFGLAKFKQTYNTEIAGTYPYLEPQILVYNRTSQEVKENEAVDIWAIGILTYKLLTFQHPFIFQNSNKNPNEQIKENIRKGILYWGVNGCEISLEALCFLDSCLKIDQNHRLSAEELEYSEFLCRNPNNFSLLNENTFNNMPDEIKVNEKKDDRIIQLNMTNSRKLSEILNI